MTLDFLRSRIGNVIEAILSTAASWIGGAILIAQGVAGGLEQPQPQPLAGPPVGQGIATTSAPLVVAAIGAFFAGMGGVVIPLWRIWIAHKERESIRRLRALELRHHRLWEDHQELVRRFNLAIDVVGDMRQAIEENRGTLIEANRLHPDTVKLPKNFNRRLFDKVKIDELLRPIVLDSSTSRRIPAAPPPEHTGLTPDPDEATALDDSGEPL